MTEHKGPLKNDNQAKEDPFLDSALEEILGGIAPPDLSAKILERYERMKKKGSRFGGPASGRKTAHAKKYKAKRERPWANALMLALGIAAIVSTVSYLLKIGSPPQLVEKSDAGASVSNAHSRIDRDRLLPKSTQSPRRISEDDEIDFQQIEREIAKDRDENERTQNPNPKIQPPVDERLFPESKFATIPPSSDESIIASIDGHFEKRWESKVETIIERKWFERVFQTLVDPNGHRESDWRKFIALNKVQRKELFIDQLFSVDAYREKIAERISETWSSGMSVDQAEIAKVFAEGLASNRPMNLVVGSLIEKSHGIASEKASLFFDQRFSCSSCHDDKEGDGLLSKQQYLAISEAFNNDESMPKLVEQAVNYDGMSRQIVNRQWAALFEFGLVDNVQSLLVQQASNEPLLNELAGAFTANGHDLKRLVKWMVLSKPFSVPDTPNGKIALGPEMDASPLFNWRYSRPETEQRPLQAILASVLKHNNIVSGKPMPKELLGSRQDLDASKILEDPSFLKQLARVSAMQVDAGTFLPQLADCTLDQRIEHVSWAILNRKPSSSEQKLAKEVLENRDNPLEGLKELWWSFSQVRPPLVAK